MMSSAEQAKNGYIINARINSLTDAMSNIKRVVNNNTYIMKGFGEVKAWKGTMEEKFGKVEERFGEVKNDMGNLKDDLKSDINNLQGELNTLNSEVT